MPEQDSHPGTSSGGGEEEAFHLTVSGKPLKAPLQGSQ